MFAQEAHGQQLQQNGVQNCCLQILRNSWRFRALRERFGSVPISADSNAGSGERDDAGRSDMRSAVKVGVPGSLCEQVELELMISNKAAATLLSDCILLPSCAAVLVFPVLMVCCSVLMLCDFLSLCTVGGTSTSKGCPDQARDPPVFESRLQPKDFG